MKHLLTIAGSDCSGGAGIQADLKTFAALGTYGMSVITAVTAQNTTAVTAIQNIEPQIIQAQIAAIFDDIQVDAVKIGMLSCSATVKAVAESLRKYAPKIIVIDPVMVSKSGSYLLQNDSVHCLINELFPLATVITPNIPEAEILAKMKINNQRDMELAAAKILKMGPKYVVLKGGHLTGKSCDDLVLGKNIQEVFSTTRIDNKNTHGTGCSLSSAIAVYLANGKKITAALNAAKKYVAIGIEHGLDVGKGTGPIHHFVELYKKAGILE